MPNLARIAEPIKALIEALVGRRLDYHALYPCTVAAQDGNTLELIPDDARVKGFGLGSVAIKPGAPGYEYEVPAGSRVLLGFEAADPKRPYCALWESETDVTTLTFDGGSADIARTGDSVDAGFLVYGTIGGIVQDVGAFPAIQYFPAGIIGAAAASAMVGFINGAGGVGVSVAMTGGVITSGNSKLKA